MVLATRYIPRSVEMSLFFALRAFHQHSTSNGSSDSLKSGSSSKMALSLYTIRNTPKVFPLIRRTLNILFRLRVMTSLFLGKTSTLFSEIIVAKALTHGAGGL